MAIIYLPLEHIDMRYTKYLDEIVTDYLETNNIKHYKLFPEIPPREIKAGSFLDAPTTIEFKSKQMAMLAEMYHNDTIKDGDIIFTTDLWFPGIEGIAYLNYFTGKKVKLRGFIHAGSFTDTDFVRDMERWAKGFEDILFDISEKIYVASDFIKNDLLKKRYISNDKIVVSGLPLDNKNFIEYKQKDRENIIIFNGRNVDEKQPWLFDQLEERLGHKAKFVNTQKQKLSKQEYYKLLGKAKGVVSFALQENFGIGVNEAVELGCIPILPNRLVYPEYYRKEYLYDNFEECVNKVEKVIDNKLPQTKGRYFFNIKSWFEC